MRALNRGVREFNPQSQRHALGAPQTQARFVMDIYGEEDWTEMDIEDLRAAI
jgi:hypothetical protein